MPMEPLNGVHYELVERGQPSGNFEVTAPSLLHYGGTRARERDERKLACRVNIAHDRHGRCWALGCGLPIRPSRTRGGSEWGGWICISPRGVEPQ